MAGHWNSHIKEKNIHSLIHCVRYDFLVNNGLCLLSFGVLWILIVTPPCLFKRKLTLKPRSYNENVHDWSKLRCIRKTLASLPVNLGLCCKLQNNGSGRLARGALPSMVLGEAHDADRGALPRAALPSLRHPCQFSLGNFCSFVPHF